MSQDHIPALAALSRVRADIVSAAATLTVDQFTARMEDEGDVENYRGLYAEFQALVQALGSFSSDTLGRIVYPDAGVDLNLDELWDQAVRRTPRPGDPAT
ncbi:MAG: hypothetical protein EHM13_06390 [Acidobacteria bacterium]|nr:MAG: hypothetical protein EHM13_06390 [Acidobacteriota bacterium]